MKHLILVCLMFFQVFHWNAQPPVPVPVSIIELMSRPKEFDGKLVSVRGLFTADYHGTTLLVGQEDYLHALQENGIWLDPPSEMGEKTQLLEGKYVLVAGKFSAKERLGRAGRQVGGLTQVQTCALWSDPIDPIGKRFREAVRKQQPGY